MKRNLSFEIDHFIRIVTSYSPKHIGNKYRVLLINALFLFLFDLSVPLVFLAYLLKSKFTTTKFFTKVVVTSKTLYDKMEYDYFFLIFEGKLRKIILIHS